MAGIKIKPKKFKIQFIANTDTSIHAGLPVIEAMARRFGLWKKIDALRCLDPRKDRSRGYSPAVIVGQLIYALCSGGGCLSDSEALNDDPLVRELFGVAKFADQSQVGEWLRAQTEEGIAALRALLREFVEWIISRAKPDRLLFAGRTEVFFDDTQIEVSSGRFEGAKLNYDGDIALSWQCLWVGPLLADAHLGGAGEVSSELPAMLAENRALWTGKRARFWADSGSSAGVYLNALNAQGFDYSVSYNKWTGPLERTAAELPPSAWSDAADDGPRKRQSHAWVRHQPEGCEQVQLFAVTRWKREGEMFERYGFIACDAAQEDAKMLIERHRLKGEKERLFSEVLGGMDLHHPPCHSLAANRAYYLIAALAYNLVTAVKLIDLGDAQQSWQFKTMLKKLIFLPGRLSRKARQWVAKIQVPGQWLSWWERWQTQAWPESCRNSMAAMSPTSG